MAGKEAHAAYSALSPQEPPQGSSKIRVAAATLCALAFVLAAAAGCVGVALARRGAPVELRFLSTEPIHRQARLPSASRSEAPASPCDEGAWSGRGPVCGGCRVVVEDFGAEKEEDGRRRLRGAGSGTCNDFCRRVGHTCRGAWHAADRGACTAVWELELSCQEEMAANQTVCLCGEKLPQMQAVVHKKPEHIARAVHHEHKNKTEEQHKNDHVKQLLAKVHFPKPPPCNQFEVGVDFWTKAMLWTVPQVISVEKCNEHCELEPRCGAWTWGKKRDVPGLSDVCFLKVVAEDGSFKRAEKDGVVSGVRSEQRLCTASEMAEFLEETSAAKKAQAETQKAAGVLGDKASAEVNKAAGARNRTTSAKEEEKKDAKKKEPVEEDADKKKEDKKDDADKDKGTGHKFETGVRHGVVKSRGGNCLTAPDKANSTGRVQMWACSDDDMTQAWTFDGHKGQLRNHFGLCLAATARTTEFTKLSMERCDTDQWDQQWDFYLDTNLLKNWEGICVDAAESNIDGGMVYMRACHTESRNQQWMLGPLDSLPSTDDVGMHPSGTSLFCFALMIPHSYEQELLAMQYSHKVSLFQCEGYAVYSNVTTTLATGLTTRPIDSDLQCKKGGEFGTALNLPIFLALWERLVADKMYLAHDWSVKVDPDAVFFAARLRRAVSVHMETEKGVYLNNCRYGLHGPIEVFSRNAVTTWWAGRKQCQDYFWKLCKGDCFWGEDLFVDQCLWKVLGVRRNNDYRLLVEDHCDPPKGWDDCKDSAHVSFHPFKDTKSYMKCLQTASKQAPLPLK